METRARKRANGSAPDTPRPSRKRSRHSSNPPSVTPPATTNASNQATGRASRRSPVPAASAPAPSSSKRASSSRAPPPPPEAAPTAPEPRATNTNMDRRERNSPHDNEPRPDGVDEDEARSAALSRNLASASSAFHDILRKLGAGLDDLLPGAAQANSRLKVILAGLRAEGDEGRQLEALSALCELLSIATEESLSTFSVDSFVPLLVSLLNSEHNPDLMLLAARALTHLADVLPSSCAGIVHYGAVDCFCARLLTIEYIDLAEQSLQALEKLSHEHPVACLRAGGLMAVLSYLDFFATGVQRVAVTTAANMCRQLPADAGDLVTDAVPILTNLLQYPDAKLVEQACISLSRISENFASSPERISTICSSGLIEQAARLVSPANTAPLSVPTYTCMIRLLATCAAGSPTASESLLKLGITSTVRDAISGSAVLASTPTSPASMIRTSDQLYEILSLVNELLPPLPDTSILGASPVAAMPGIGAAATPTRSSPRRRGSEADDVSCLRAQALKQHPELLNQAGNDLLALLIQVYNVSTSAGVRNKALSSVSKFVHFAPAEMLESTLKDIHVSSFLAGLLTGREASVSMIALQIAEVLMSKLPSIFSKYFLKEGVVHAIEQLASTTVQSGSAIPTGRSRSAGSRQRSSQDRGTPDTKAGAAGTPASAGTPSTPSLSPRTPRSTGTRALVVQRAQNFKRTYFSEDGGSPGGVTEGLAKLRAIATTLQDDKLSAAKQEKALQDLFNVLTHGEGISTFEFVGSGTAEALRKYLSANGLEDELRHVRSFLNASKEASAGSSDGNSPALTALVNKLQDALSTTENFPVLLSQGPRSSGSSLGGQLAGLTQPFKLRLCRASAEHSLRDYSSNIVLIEPLATLSAVEDFLWPRVKRGDTTSQPAVPPPPVTEAAGSSKSASKHAAAPPPPKPTGSSPSGEGGSAPMTRSAAKAAAGAPTEAGSSGSGSKAAEASGKGKGKVGNPPANDKGKNKGPAEGRVTRAQAAATRRDDYDGEKAKKTVASMMEDTDMPAVPGMDGASDMEDHVDDDEMDEDEDDEDDEDDEGLDDDEDDEGVYGHEGLGCSERVHDVQLGEASEESAGAGPSSAGPSSQQPASASAPGSAAAEAGASGSAAPPPRFTEGRGGSAGPSSASRSAPPSSSNDRRTAAAAAAAAATPRLIFSIDGAPIAPGMTIFQAIQRRVSALEEAEADVDEEAEEDVHGRGKRLWDEVYTLEYCRYTEELAQPPVMAASDSSSEEVPSSSQEALPAWAQPLASLLKAKKPCEMPIADGLKDVLSLLRILDALVRMGPRMPLLSNGATQDATKPIVATEEFLNSKLTSKLSRQLQDVLTLCSGGIPSWCKELTVTCAFLFPFECRRQYFYCTAFGLSRALQRLQAQQGTNGTESRELRVGRLQRQKVRVSRTRILDSALKVMDIYCQHKAVLEVEYFGEVGTGLGPTLEFYTLVSQELQKRKLHMWRNDEDGPPPAAGEPQADHDYVRAPFGLFPSPIPPTKQGPEVDKVVERFRLLGRVMAKALQDGRLLDLSLSFPFYKLVLGKSLDLYDIRGFDPQLAATLEQMDTLCRRKQELTAPGASADDIEALTLRDCKVSDLSLDFTLPGYDDYELCPDGANTLVTIHNLDEFMEAVVKATVETGIARQMEAFRSGFEQVFPLASLQAFSPPELEILLCGCVERWATEELTDNIKFDHGYTATSSVMVQLLEILVEFSAEDQRKFLRFVTGAPRLPPGGLSALTPKLTIVRKQPSGLSGGSSPMPGTSPVSPSMMGGTTAADSDLPSVMTCANYLKLPPYSSKEIMRDRLMYAINEGSGSFDLS